MLVPERRSAIMTLLGEKHAVSVSELSKKLFMSETSIRRDLTYLEKEGLLRKTYGGAILLPGENQELSLSARKETEKAAKSIIAQKAISLIHDGDVIFLDSSSTTLAIVPFIRDFTDLTIITNGAKAALALSDLPFTKVYCAGGRLNPRIYSYNGPIALQSMEHIRADKCFISPKALDITQGAFCVNEAETSIRKAMINQSRETILLCASKKLGKQAVFFLCPFESLHTVVLDDIPDEQWETCFRENNIQVL